jgi:hypothetical protein
MLGDDLDGLAKARCSSIDRAPEKVRVRLTHRHPGEATDTPRG